MYEFLSICVRYMVKNNPIPADRSRWSRFEELNERNQILLRDILQTSAAKQGGSPIDQQIGDYYGACMDEKAIEQKGISPLKPELDRIAAMKDKSDTGGSRRTVACGRADESVQLLWASGL